MAVISIVVTVRDDSVSRTREICADLTHRGLTVESEMPELGLIFGRGEAGCLPELARLRGVAEAYPEDRFDLPPVGDDIPQ